jgi:tetratricopeptide (TPR) repeat protein
LIRHRVLFAAALLAAAPATADVWVFADPDGATHVTEDPAAIPQDAAPLPGAGAGALAGGRLVGPEVPAATASRSDAQRRADRIVSGAIDDLRRGDTARAAAAFESVLVDEPRDPVAHWYLAEIDRQRGRLDAAAQHLDAFLAHAGDAYEPWRATAERRRHALADEERLEVRDTAPLRLVAAESPYFRVAYDARLGEASPDYARTVLRYLDEAHRSVTARIGVAPREPIGVVLYAKAAYLAAHRHRFSFPTVGFFDGRIHVASAAHPEGELRSLLFHEYTHAVFADRTGGDRPFWLNEGLAELSERGGRGEAALTRTERAALHRYPESGEWIPLARLAPGFGGLDEAEARAAYLEATAAAAWLESRLDARGVGVLLDALGRGQPIDTVLRHAVGVDTAGLEAALQHSIAAEFPGP